MKLGKCYVENVINLDLYLETKGFQENILIIHGTKDRMMSYTDNTSCFLLL